MTIYKMMGNLKILCVVVLPVSNTPKLYIYLKYVPLNTAVFVMNSVYLHMHYSFLLSDWAWNCNRICTVANQQITFVKDVPQ